MLATLARWLLLEGCMSARLLQSSASLLLCGVLMSGCNAAPAPDACTRLRDALSACPKAEDEDLVFACTEDPEAEAVAEQLTASACTKADGKADGIGGAAFLGACTSGVLAGSVLMRLRNASGQPLPRAWKAALRPHYGELVDQVKVHWGAVMLDSLPRVYTSNTVGQTFGNHVYIENRCGDDESVFSTVAHELEHVAQARALGGLAGFAAMYCHDFAAAGFDYSDNALEREARAHAGQVMGALPATASLDCR